MNPHERIREATTRLRERAEETLNDDHAFDHYDAFTPDVAVAVADLLDALRGHLYGDAMPFRHQTVRVADLYIGSDR